MPSFLVSYLLTLNPCNCYSQGHTVETHSTGIFPLILGEWGSTRSRQDNDVLSHKDDLYSKVCGDATYCSGEDILDEWHLIMKTIYIASGTSSPWCLFSYILVSVPIQCLSSRVFLIRESSGFTAIRN